ncbi:MAG: hypothetical protein IH631_06345, partial [Candidatus Thorarchaeota archaeon]|nr:hypothetical protein [Candidatus Thorarchaeota archaeon]
SPLASLGIEDESITGFFAENAFAHRIVREGKVYACGTATGPTDIPTSIAEANAVALRVYSDLTGGV